MNMMLLNLSTRSPARVIQGLWIGLLLCCCLGPVAALEAEQRPPATPESPQLGNGMRNSWAEQHSIVFWTRTTARAEMVTDGPEFLQLEREQVRQWENHPDEKLLLDVQLPDGAELSRMKGACPGIPGEVRITWFPENEQTLSQSTDWTVTKADDDYTCQWTLRELSAGTRYIAVVEARPVGSSQVTAVLRGRFQTAPMADQPVPQTFCMTTCHDYIRRDAESGHRIYPAMTKLAPDWMIHAGDVEYYDKPNPWALTVDLMRFKWARLFSLPGLREFYSGHTSYFIKDDHDTLKNDCWSGQSYGAVSFEQGVHLFNHEQFPSRTPRYMTVRWGRDVQFWILEGRDFRSPNTMKDGPEKTILGNEQKQWLLETVRASTATYKLVFSPTPVVGPDREKKSDNHANQTFEYEGLQLRDALSAVDGLIVFCGDRHWQYASVDSETGLWEFGCGPGSEHHESGWQEGDVRPEHRFLRVQGGFLSGQLTYTSPDGLPSLLIRHHTVDGEEVSRFRFPAEADGAEDKP
jgi:alkaline phosphatase D